MKSETEEHSSAFEVLEDRLREAEEAVSVQDPDAVRLYFEASTVALEAGLLNRSVAALLRLLDIRPDYPAAHLRLAEVYLELGGDSPAVNHLEVARKLYSARGELESLDRALRLLTRLAPERADVLDQLGRISHLAGKEDLALKCLRRAVALYRKQGETAALQALESRFPVLRAPVPPADLPRTTHRNLPAMRLSSGEGPPLPPDDSMAVSPAQLKLSSADLASALASPAGNTEDEEWEDEEVVDLDAIISSFTANYPTGD